MSNSAKQSFLPQISSFSHIPPPFLVFLVKSMTPYFILVDSTSCVHTPRREILQDLPTSLSKVIFLHCVNYNEVFPNTDSQSQRGNQVLHSVPTLVPNKPKATHLTSHLCKNPSLLRLPMASVTSISTCVHLKIRQRNLSTFSLIFYSR